MNRVNVAVAALAAGIGLAGGWQLRGLLAPPPAPRVVEVRAAGGRREAFVHGAWRPVVAATRSRLEAFEPPQLTPGEVAHLNADGTVLVTSHVEAARRAAAGGGGWPPAAD
jgi:hypothetical protein